MFTREEILNGRLGKDRPTIVQKVNVFDFLSGGVVECDRDNERKKKKGKGKGRAAEKSETR